MGSPRARSDSTHAAPFRSHTHLSATDEEEEASEEEDEASDEEEATSDEEAASSHSASGTPDAIVAGQAAALSPCHLHALTRPRETSCG